MKRPWPPPFFGLSFVQGCYAVCLTWTDTNDTCGCPPCLRKPPRTSAQTTYPDASHNRDNASNIVISPAGKHSASGEARYSVTPFKEAETDLPPEAYAAFRRCTAALDPHAIADACRNLLEEAVHLRPFLHGCWYGRLRQAVGKTPTPPCRIPDPSLTPRTPGMLTFL